MKLKKSQMEIMGLAIIIVLLMIGMLFYVRYSMSQEPRTLKKTFKEKETIANFVNALRLTTVTECNNALMEQLLIDCANDHLITIGCSVPMTDCTTELKNFIEQRFLPATLKKWNIAYTLNFSDANGGELFVLYHNDSQSQRCSQSNIGRKYTKMERDQKPIPLGNGNNMFIDIMICS